MLHLKLGLHHKSAKRLYYKPQKNMNKSDLSETDKAFYQDGIKLAEIATKEKCTDQKLWQATRQEQDAMGGLIDALSAEAKRHNITIDCKKGCTWCCHQPVYAVSHEFHFMWQFMQLNMTEAERKIILKKAFDNYQQKGRLSDEELKFNKLPCPLLVNGACSIYDARPMACRIYLSMSETSCKKFHNQPKDKTNFPALLEFPLQAGQMINEGFTEGLRNAKLYNTEYLLEEGLLIAHNNGEPIKNGDIKNNPLFMLHE